MASLSLDLDNKWSYLKVHGDPGWEKFPSYLDVVVPRFLEFFRQRGLKITVFVVGQDAALVKNHAAIKSISAEGHEIGNHSFHHEPWLHRYTEKEVESELSEAEQCIGQVTGQRCVGFRGPGFSLSRQVLRVLAQRGYHYDASTLPTYLGPLAKAYYFLTAKLNAQQKRERKQLFGRFREGFRPIRPYCWQLPEGPLLEIPVTTMPLCRIPFHMSYLLYLSKFSRRAAVQYFRGALRLCRVTQTQPSILLHPLDFLGREDRVGLDFFPAAGLPTHAKLDLVAEVIDRFSAEYEIVPLREHAAALLGKRVWQAARDEWQGATGEREATTGKWEVARGNGQGARGNGQGARGE